MIIPKEIASYLGRLIDEDLDRSRDHVAWLQSPAAAAEPDREEQVAESGHAVALAEEAAKLFPLA